MTEGMQTMSCETCPHANTQSVPWSVFDSMRASKDRTILFLCIVILILVIVIITGVALYEVREAQYEETDTEEESEISFVTRCNCNESLFAISAYECK